MELSTYAAALKTQLATDLEKVGSSLAEFEEALAGLNTGEGACKVASLSAAFIGEALSKVGGAFGDLSDNLVKYTALAGAGAGYSLGRMGDSVDLSYKAEEHELAKINMVRKLTKALQREHEHLFKPIH